MTINFAIIFGNWDIGIGLSWTFLLYE